MENDATTTQRHSSIGGRQELAAEWSKRLSASIDSYRQKHTLEWILTGILMTLVVLPEVQNAKPVKVEGPDAFLKAQGKGLV